jgi:hypothetical protein
MAGATVHPTSKSMSNRTLAMTSDSTVPGN